jgi:hypothetical protein
MLKWLTKLQFSALHVLGSSLVISLAQSHGPWWLLSVIPVAVGCALLELAADK